MQDFKDSDRRVFERFLARLALKYINLHSNKEGQAHTTDVCANGICINANEEFPRSTPLEMWLRIPNRIQPIYTRAEVIWSSMAGENNYKVGLKLERPDLMELARVLKIVNTPQK